MTDLPQSEDIAAPDEQRQRIWEGLCQRAARRDAAVAEAQRTVERNPERYARTVWLAEEAMALALRMAQGEF